MKILNLTQHVATQEQKDAGVIDLAPEDRKVLIFLLTFDEIPSNSEMWNLAKKICYLAEKSHPDKFVGEFGDQTYPPVMIGGAPFFMAPLEKTLSEIFTVLYAFSKRVSVDESQQDGTVIKKNGLSSCRFR